MTEIATVKANCLYNTPVKPPIKATGTNTEINTKAIPITGPCTFSIAATVAAFGFNPLYRISYSTASITTMASSTTRPMASTMASNVSVLIVKPITWKAAKVPIKDTGTAIIGITVDCQVCKNKYTIIATRSKASAKVFTTSFIDAFTNFVLSTITFACISGGNASSCC